MAKILVVDDNIDMLDTLEHLFTFYDFEVLRAENGKVGFEIAMLEKPGIIILDGLMPVMNGFETCEKLKSNHKTKGIPVIFLSANYTDRPHLLMGYELGADDYILKPFNAKELIAKVKMLLHRTKLIKKICNENRFLQRQMLEQNVPGMKFPINVQDSAEIDSPSGLYNVTFFKNFLVKNVTPLIGATNHLAILLIDVGNFQTINTVYGSKTSDYVLTKIANILIKNTAAPNLVFRAGKNKFGIFLLNSPDSDTIAEGERIRLSIQRTRIFDRKFFQQRRMTPRRKQSKQNITVSIGITSLDPKLGSSALLTRAEEALYETKMADDKLAVKYSNPVRN